MARITKAELASENARLASETALQHRAIQALATETPDFAGAWEVDGVSYEIRTYGVARADGGVVVVIRRDGAAPSVHVDYLEAHARRVHDRYLTTTPAACHAELRYLDDALQQAREDAQAKQRAGWNAA